MSIITDIVKRTDAKLAEQEQKLAISHHPELAGREHVLVQRASGVMMEEMAAFADYATVYKTYTWVKKAISVLANNFAPLPVRVVDADSEEQLDHPVSRLLTSVNDEMSAVDLWEIYIVHKMLGGETFFEIVDNRSGEPLEMWPRRPDQVGLQPDVSDERRHFPRVAQYVWPDEDRPIDPEHMWHDKFYNPESQWRGLAPIAAVRAGIVIDLFAQAWSKAFLQRGARPDYALVAQQGITKTEKEELEFSLTQKFGGIQNTHKPIILEEGITDIKTFSFAPKDIEWLEQRKFARDEVGATFGVPDGLMGYGREAYDNSDKLNANMLALWTLTLGPLVNRRDIGLTHFFTKVRPMLEPGQRVETDTSGVGALQEDDGPKIDKAKTLFSIGVPFNMIDERLDLGFGEIPGGDVGYLPVNLLPVGSAIREEPAPNGDGDGPPADEEPEDEPDEEEQEPGENGQASFAPPRTKQGIEYGSDRHKALWDQHRTRLSGHERAMQRELKRQFQRQQNDVLRRFRELAGSGSKGQKVTIELPSAGDLFNRREQVRLFVEVFTPYFTRAANDFGETQAGEFGIDFDLRDPLQEAALKKQALVFAEEVNDTTLAGIRGALSQTLEEGLSIPASQDLLNDVFDGRKSDFETERIARTELSKSATTGNLSAARQAQSLGLKLRKGWLSALGTRTRDTHIAAHIRYQRNPIAIEDNFQVGACSGPGPAQTGCAEEDVNCRCTPTFEVIR